MLYRLMNRTSDGIDNVLKFLDIFIRTEALNDMRANANTITTVRFVKFIFPVVALIFKDL